MRLQRFLGAFLLLILFVLAGCGAKKSSVEKDLSRLAPEAIGIADSYKVKLGGSKGDMVRRVQVDGVNVQPVAHLVAPEFSLTLSDVQVQKDPFRILGTSSSLFSMRLTEKSINDYLKETNRVNVRGMRNISVRFLKDTMQVTAITTVLDRDVELLTNGLLQPLAGTQLVYLPQTVSVGGLDVPATIQQELAARINPVIDMAPFRFAPRITAVTVKAGEVVIEGTADLRQVTLD